MYVQGAVLVLQLLVYALLALFYVLHHVDKIPHGLVLLFFLCDLVVHQLLRCHFRQVWFVAVLGGIVSQ